MSEPPPSVARMTAPPAAPTAPRPPFCQWSPVIGARKPDDMRCPECGHSDLAHIGVDHCPVCELVYQATPEFRRQQQRIAGIPARETW